MRMIMLDAGGVLYKNMREDTLFFTHVAEEFNVSSAALAELYKNCEWSFETDLVDVRDVLWNALVRLGVSAELLPNWDYFDKLYLRYVLPYTDTFNLIQNLRSINHIKIALANNEAFQWDAIKNRKYAHFELFDYVTSSWVVHAKKPSIDFFMRALALCKTSPSDVLFIDDNQDVINAAQILGFNTVLFLTPLQLQAELAAHDIVL